MPDPWYRASAVAATPFFEIVREDGVSTTFDDTFPAFMAVRVFRRVGGNVADIDIFHPFSHRRGVGVFQPFDGGRSKAIQFVERDEAAEMQRGAGETVMAQPGTHAPDHVQVVGPTGDDKVRDLEPYSHLAKHPERTEDGCKSAGIEPGVDGFVKTL